MIRSVLIVFLLGVAPPALAGPAGAEEARTVPKVDPAIVMTEGFLSAHPDLRWRADGLRAYEKKDYGRALSSFTRAASFADKPAQALVAGMYWDGIGVAQDRPLAYAWMDLAAERLYHDFVVFRERYWNALTEAEREQAVSRGKALYAQYGDDVAKPRQEAVLVQERRKVTGSRTGYLGPLTIIPMTGPLAGTGMTLSGEQYYADKYWEPRAYWQLHDAIWKAPINERVDVGDPEVVDGKKQK
ncbi:SEL1-like repeat protein [Pseudoxanthomonas sp. 10H]|uniref:hypothetical protein n=1 Tax=Pseudoxanthomonas sp. 10H TaxID=3242729 RepID=UPI00355876F4